MTKLNECQHVCVIGIGDMGSALADVLLAKGHKVTVWNRTAPKCDALAAAGASVAPSVAEGAAASDVIVICVSDHNASTATLQTDDVATALSGKLLVQLTTVTADQSRALGHWAGDNGIDYLDGAILGYPQNMRNQECPVVYSGTKAGFDAKISVLAAMGGSPRFLGEAIGGAPNFDKAILSCHYGSMLALFHGAAICRSAGFPIEVFTDLALGEVTRSTQRLYGEMIASGSYEVIGASMEVDSGAMAQVIKVSETLGVDAALPKLVASYINRAIADGHGQEELPALFETLVNNGANHAP